MLYTEGNVPLCFLNRIERGEGKSGIPLSRFTLRQITNGASVDVARCCRVQTAQTADEQTLDACVSSVFGDLSRVFGFHPSSPFSLPHIEGASCTVRRRSTDLSGGVGKGSSADSDVSPVLDAD